MRDSSFLLLDANVVIQLFRCGAWRGLTERSTVYVARTIVEREAHFYEDEDGKRVDFDLRQDEAAGSIQVVDATLAQTSTFLSQFDPLYGEKLDPGELESLAYLADADEAVRICSADAIVFRVLGNLDCSERGVSLEEVLKEAGLGRKLTKQYSKEFRVQYTAKGVEERLRGIGTRKKEH
jgi:hypothetical protein